jgi:hypothetical protein
MNTFVDISKLSDFNAFEDSPFPRLLFLNGDFVVLGFLGILLFVILVDKSLSEHKVKHFFAYRL